MKINRKSC